MPTTSAQIVSAIITPALLILATSSLITATAHRISGILERVRDLAKEVEIEGKGAPSKKKHDFLVAQLFKATVRAKLIQRAMVCLYMSLGSAILTSVTVGVGTVMGFETTGPVLVLIFAAVGLLFFASTLLIRESRIALSAVDAEMEFVRRLA